MNCPCILKFIPILLLLLLKSVLCAENVLIQNHSFEEPVIRKPDQQPWKNGVPAGWLSSETDKKQQYVQFAAKANPPLSDPDGKQLGGIKRPGVYWFQDLGLKFKPNTTYTIDIAASYRGGQKNGRLEFGLSSGGAAGVDIGAAGFIDIKGMKAGSGSSDADGGLNRFRYASELSEIKAGKLAKVYSFTTGDQPPKGNLVVYIRNSGTRGSTSFDDISLTATPAKKAVIPELAIAPLFAGLVAFAVCALRRKR